jgi:hypothetical protein
VTIQNRRSLSFTSIYLVVLLTCASGCEPSDEGDDEGTVDELVIAGEYTDEWGDTHTIDEVVWTNSGGVWHIEQWDNEAMFLVAHNDEANMFSPGLYSRFDWVWSGDDLYYCQSVFDGATLEAALAGSANRDDLALGCGGFAWTNLTP